VKAALIEESSNQSQQAVFQKQKKLKVFVKNENHEYDADAAPEQ
jgi:hypothetical protein